VWQHTGKILLPQESPGFCQVQPECHLVPGKKGGHALRGLLAGGGRLEDPGALERAQIPLYHLPGTAVAAQAAAAKEHQERFQEHCQTGHHRIVVEQVHTDETGDTGSGR